MSRCFVQSKPMLSSQSLHTGPNLYLLASFHLPITTGFYQALFCVKPVAETSRGSA